MATATHQLTEKEATAHPPSEAVVVRFAGDSGDGMQLTGGQFTLSTALAGNDLATFPDFPAEIRAPQGTTFGVSAFQINFGSAAIETAGDQPDVLIAMNPAALKVNADQLREGGLIIADEGEFTARNLAKAGYEQNPLEDGSLAKWQVVHFNISQLTLDAVKPFGLGNKEALRCKNMWTLGLALWMFDRDRQPIVDWLKAKFAKAPELAEANIAALNAGHAYGETAEMGAPFKQHHIAPAPAEPGLYRTVTGAEALALGLVAGCQLAGLKMFFGSYPITPASPLLHHLARLKEFGITTFQAEDEIAAICAAIGASYAGHLGITSSSGPGIALKTEGGRPRRDDRAALDRRQFAARRPFDWPSDEDRAVRPLPGGLRPQRRFAGAGDRRPLARGRVRMRDRGVPHRDPLHDARHAPDRRLYRQRRRAVARAGHERIRAVPGEVLRHRAGGRAGGDALFARRRPRAAVDQAGHARPRAPHRRDREAARHRQHRLFARRPPGDDRDPRRQGAGRRQLASPIRRYASAAKAPSWRSSAGARPSVRSTRRCAARSPEGRTSPTSTCATSGRCRKICLSY